MPSEKNEGCSVDFSGDMIFLDQRDAFLSNDTNKSRFISLLGKALEENGYDVIYAEGDADNQIVKAAIDISFTDDCIVIAKDTDFLCLLIYHWQDHYNYEVPNKKKTKER